MLKNKKTKYRRSFTIFTFVLFHLYLNFIVQDGKCQVPAFVGRHCDSPKRMVSEQTFFSGLKYKPCLADSFLSEKQNFVVYYTKQGKDAVPLTDENLNNIPDRVEKIAEAFEKSYYIEIVKMRFRKPPQFYEIARPYEIYVEDLENCYGTTVRENIDDSVLEQKCLSSHILFDNDFEGSAFIFKGDSAIEATAAHEFFHAIQLSYVYRKSDFYFIELSAVWMEHKVFENNINYIYNLNYFLSSPDIPLNAIAFTIPNVVNHFYGAAIFAFYIEEKFGTDAIRQIWRLMPDMTAFEAMDSYFQKKGSSFEKEFTTFSMWNFFTGERSRSNEFYSESAKYPEVKTEFDKSLPDHFSYNGEGRFLTSRYFIFYPQTDGDYSIRLSAEIPDHWRLGVVHYCSDSVHCYIGAVGENIEIQDVSEDQMLIVVPCNVDFLNESTQTYYKEKPEEYSFSIQKQKNITSVNTFQISQSVPNPTSSVVTFYVDQSEIKPFSLKIFNILGQLIDQKEITFLSPGFNRIHWNFCDCNQQLPAGIYFFRFSDGSNTFIKKVIFNR